MRGLRVGGRFSARYRLSDGRGHGLPVEVAKYWEGRHVVVTGGSSGIGLEVTRMALAAGALVSVIALEDAALAALSARVPEESGRLAAIAADVTRPEDMRVALQRARAQYGRVQAVIVCAGIAKPNYFSRLEIADFEKHMAVNYFGALHVIRDVLPDLREGERDSITVISSMAGVLPCFGYGAYSPSKFAVRALCEVLRQELRPAGVSVTVVLPPDVDTPQLSAEAATKPAELVALSGSAPIAATTVARALMIGAARGRATVVPSRSARLLRWLAGAAPRLMARVMDAIIAGAQRRAMLANAVGSPGASVEARSRLASCVETGSSAR
ncbi:SDR family NAD(P)-dependent oxidoreductase [Nocardia sp. NPDC059240]|uniref:SDR family NAD(P)-dependent oxidoreductase n=1 Tax=Nocardia sp. NPDC059240 TaxID=3346786 RepID=UPI00367FF6AA